MKLNSALYSVSNAYMKCDISFFVSAVNKYFQQLFWKTCQVTSTFTDISVNIDFPGGTVVRNPPAMQEILEAWVWSLGWEDPLEEEMATHSSIFAWKIPWTEEPGGLQSMGSQSLRHNLVTEHARIHLHVIVPFKITNISKKLFMSPKLQSTGTNWYIIIVQLL